MLTDLRLALRFLQRAPALALVAVLVLGLGIGANVTAFSWLEGMVLRPFPAVRRQDALVRVRTVESGRTQTRTSLPNYRDWRAAARSFSGLAAYQSTQLGVMTRPGGAARPTLAAYVSPDYFAILGVAPALGRGLLPGDDVPGAGPAVVLGDALWRERFAADRAVVGSRVWINGRAATVVGVMPPAFHGTDVGITTQLWAPLHAVAAFEGNDVVLTRRGVPWLELVGRLRPGVTAAQAAADLDAVGRVVAERTPVRETRPLVLDFGADETRQTLLALLGVLLAGAGLVLLLVCANVANLFLVRGLEREHVYGVHMAVGAGRGRIVRQHVFEAAVVALCGGALGVGLAYGLRGALSALIPDLGVQLHVQAPLDARVLAVAALLAAIVTVLAGTAPALRAGRTDAATLLRAGGRVVRRRPRLVSALVVAQVTLATVALVGAGLLGRTVVGAGGASAGFEAPTRVLLFRTEFAYVGRRDAAAQQVAADAVLQRLRALPGVRAVGAADFVPLGPFGAEEQPVAVEGHAPSAEDPMVFMRSRVTTGYFAAVGVPLLRGRDFGVADGPAAGRVAIVSEAFARRFWPDGDAVGRTVRIGTDGVPHTIVGVARDARYRMGDLARAPRPFVYTAFAQAPLSGVSYLVRADARGAAPAGLTATVRAAVASVDPALPVISPTALDRWLAWSLLPHRIASVVLASLGVVALLLATLGLSSIVAYAVAQQRRQIGVRVALGASPSRITATYVRDGARLAGAGIGGGVVLALAVGRLLASVIQGTRAVDAVAMLGVAVVLGSVALLASWLPARRAARLHPASVLRAD